MRQGTVEDELEPVVVPDNSGHVGKKLVMPFWVMIHTEASYLEG